MNTERISKVGQYASQYFATDNIAANHLSFRRNSPFSWSAPTREMETRVRKLAAMDPRDKDLVALTTSEKTYIRWALS